LTARPGGPKDAPRLRLRPLLSAFLSASLATSIAAAQAPGSDQPAPAASAPRKKDKAEAQARFKAGVTHFDRQEWSAALAEFLRSRELFPTRAATKNAAICLRRESRFDEALDMYEELLRGFPDLAGADRAFVDREIEELKDSIGLVDVGTEAGASVLIDGRDRGVTPLAAPARVSAGAHVVHVSKDGYLPFEEHVDVAGRQTVTVEAKLKATASTVPPPSPPPLALPEVPRSGPAATEPRTSRFVFEVGGGFGLAPVFGGGVLDACTGSCTTSALAGEGVFRTGFQSSGGLGFTVDLGYLGLFVTAKGRAGQIAVVGLPSNPGTFDDDLRLSALRIGASALFHFGDVWPLTFRVGAGAFVGSMQDKRTGTFKNSLGDTYPVLVTENDLAVFAYAAPELRIGRRFLDHFEVSVGVEAFVLVAVRQPKFTQDVFISTGVGPANSPQAQGDGQGTVAGGQAMTGTLVVAGMPSLALRYDF
jgi:hypothetical protein